MFDVAAELKASLLGAALRYSWRGFVQGMLNGQGRMQMYNVTAIVEYFEYDLDLDMGYT